MNYTLFYVSADRPKEDSTWSVYSEQYATEATDAPIEGTQEHVSQHVDELSAMREALRLQREYLDSLTRRYRRAYRVWYTVDGGGPRRTQVYVTDGYTTFGDIPKILAVSHFDSNDPEHVAKIEILEVTKVSKEEVR